MTRAWGIFVITADIAGQEPVGFCCFGHEARVAGTERRFAPSTLRTVVATSNTRSMRLCEAAGFVRVRVLDGPHRQYQELRRPASVESAR